HTLVAAPQTLVDRVKAKSVEVLHRSLTRALVPPPRCASACPSEAPGGSVSYRPRLLRPSRLDRRRFLLASVAGVGAPPPAAAQPEEKDYRIGILGTKPLTPTRLFGGRLSGPGRRARDRRDADRHRKWLESASRRRRRVRRARARGS